MYEDRYLWLLDDTLFIMTGLGLIDSVSDDLFSANDVTRLMIQKPGAQEGAYHLFVTPDGIQRNGTDPFQHH